MSHQPFSRRCHRTLWLQWAATHKTALVATSVAIALCMAIVTWMILSVSGDRPAAWYAMGFVHAATICAFTGLLVVTFHVQEPEAIRQLRGAWGEDFTRDELKRARRRRQIWGWVDSVPLANGDIDHLVVTRRGGIVAIDTKWRASERLTDAQAVRDSAMRARTRAQGVLTSVLETERGSHRSRGPAHRVVPAVVVWGRAQDSVPDDAEIDGVAFVRGRDLLAWLRSLEGETIDRDAAQDLMRRLEGFRSSVSKRASTGPRG